MTNTQPLVLGTESNVIKPTSSAIIYNRIDGIPVAEDVIYAGAFVIERPEEIDNIISFWPNRYMHHITLNYKPDQDYIDDLFKIELCGQEFPAKVYRIIHDHKACVALVDTDLRSMGENHYPHITIGTAEGVKPVYSNDLIQRHLNQDSDIFYANMSFRVNVRVGLCMKTGVK